MPVRHLIRSSTLAAALCAAFAAPRAIAQSTNGPLLPDAGVLPKTVVRVRQLVTFTRWDDFLGDGGRRNIGSLLATDTLGPAQLPAFAPVETSIRAASGLPNFRLTAGNVVLNADSRIMSAPLVIEYGLFSRLTLGLAVPLVQTRTTLQGQLNPAIGLANVGVNPAQLAGGALTKNAEFVQSLRSARTTLLERLSACQTDPSGAGCSTLLPQTAQIQTLTTNSDAFATALENLYGTSRDTHPGQPYVPIAGSDAQNAVGDRITSFQTQYRTFLGPDVVVGNVQPAGGPPANLAFQNILEGVGRDTLRSTSRTSIGDISVGVTYQLGNTLRPLADSTSGGVRYRAAVNGTFRIGTGQPANRNRFLDVGTGYGQNGIEGGGALDLWLGNWISLTALGSYTHQLGSIDVTRVPNAGNNGYPLLLPFFGSYSAGDVLRASVSPKIRLAGSLGVTGQYSVLLVGADKYTLGNPVFDVHDIEQLPPTQPFGLASQTLQQVGVGFTYSAAIGRRGPGALPFEVTYSHLEAIAGSGGPVAKTSRDLIELRVYLNRRVLPY